MIFIVAVIAILIVAAHIAISYLRYLPFSEQMTQTEFKTLWTRLASCGILSWLIYIAAFNYFGLIMITYKLTFALGNLLFFTTAALSLKRPLSAHFFVLGMTWMWQVTVNSIGAIIDVHVMIPLIGFIPYVFIYHTLIFLTILLITLPLEKKFLTKMLPSEGFFEQYRYGKYLVLFPFIFILGILIPWFVGTNLVHTWQERFLRLYLPLIFFIFYRYISVVERRMHESRQTKRLQEQLSALKEFSLLLQNNQEQVKVLRHDMKHEYRLIYAMLKDGRVAEVMEHIKAQEILLGMTAVKIYCKSPLINAALSVYLSRARSCGIKVRHKINLPPELKTDEGDFAILISNLLENAINASAEQSPARRKLRITIEHIDRQCVLEVTNLYDARINFDADGLPMTTRKGHGVGTASLKIFVSKYDAQLDFSQEGDEVKVLLYLEDNPR